MTVSYELGVDAALVMGYGGANQAVVSGLNSLTLPSLMREVIKISQFRTDFAVEFTGEGSHGRIGYSGNMVIGDTNGQDALKAALIANSKLTDCRVYLNLTDFIAPSTAADANAAFQVVKHEPGTGQKNGTFPYSGELCINGLYAWFTAHIVDDATPTITFSSTDNSVNDSGSGFVTAGFKAGQTVIVEGTVANDGQHTISTVAAGKIVFTADTTIVTATALEGTTLHGGSL